MRQRQEQKAISFAAEIGGRWTTKLSFKVLKISSYTQQVADLRNKTIHQRTMILLRHTCTTTALFLVSNNLLELYLFYRVTSSFFSNKTRKKRVTYLYFSVFMCRSLYPRCQCVIRWSSSQVTAYEHVIFNFWYIRTEPSSSLLATWHAPNPVPQRQFLLTSETRRTKNTF